ncbi:MAG: hypothetical protein IKZ82_02020 [Clostridia bacterium]|nr:hypothetical protein [Clostridia bacterium]
MKKLISKTIAIAVSGIFVCSSLCGCFLQEMTDSCTGRITPSPSQQVVSLDTPEASQTPSGEQPTGEVQTTPPEATPDTAPTESAGNVTNAPTRVAATPTPVPTTHEPNGMVSIGTADKPARFTMPTDLYGLTREMTEAWFADAVFIGDSITIGWKNYNNIMLESDPGFFGQTRFLCEGCYGSNHALEPISATSMHPIYAGEQHYAWDAVRMMGAKKVFILFGMNDLSISGLDGAAAKYEEVIDNIRRTNPGVQLYIISAMYMYRGSELKVLNNRNLYLYNQRLVELCARKGCEFVNIASHLIDENGFVPDEYSSDKYVHQTYEAYAVWAEVLRSLAARHLKGLPPVTFSLPQ